MMEISWFIASSGGFYEAQTVLMFPVKQKIPSRSWEASQDAREAVSFSTLETFLTMLQAR